MYSRPNKRALSATHNCRSFATPTEAQHQCTYPEVLVGSDVAAASDDTLRPGDRILTPCRDCGATPLDELEWGARTLEQTERAFTRLALDRGMALYHWSPTRHRKQITRHGLLPHRRPTTHATPSWRAPYVCFGDTASWAWALSGGQRSAPSGSWDLWTSRLSDLTEPRILPVDDVNGVHEIRTEHRVYKRHLWYVGSRDKP